MPYVLTECLGDALRNKRKPCQAEGLGQRNSTTAPRTPQGLEVCVAFGKDSMSPLTKALS